AKSANSQAEEAQGDAQSQSSSSEVSSAGSFFKSLLSDVAKLMKWIVFGLLITITLFFVLTGGLRYLANFTDWARRLLEALRLFWAGLFAVRLRGTVTADGTPGTAETTQVSFDSFANPFRDGRAAQMTPA